jgi:predicted nucleic acid-binding protein
LRVLDTTVVIDHLRGLPEARRLLREFVLSSEPLVASEVVRFELLSGVRPGEERGLEDFFESAVWAPVDERISRLAGALARQYRSAYSGIDDADYLIAGTALALNADLLTTNVRHFPMFPGLAPPY